MVGGPGRLSTLPRGAIYPTSTPIIVEATLPKLRSTQVRSRYIKEAY
jgi:hypothetical protein